MVHQLVYLHQGTINASYYEGQGNTIVIVLPIKKDAFQLANTSGATSTAFHIPSNVELHVPTIELPEGYKEGENPLDAIIQQAYVSADQEYLKRATRCIHEHMSDSDYDREAFAADMGSSVSTLYNKIRALTGKNITNFVRDIRIKKACQLAKANPDLRVSDIAYQVGFKDPKYFATSFKRVMGVQPKEYFLKVREMK
jgi:AraC-like DNA-binding protein